MNIRRATHGQAWNEAKESELISSEEAGTYVSGKHSQIAARSGQILQPAGRSAQSAEPDEQQIVTDREHSY